MMDYLAQHGLHPSLERARFKQYMQFGCNAHLLQVAYAGPFKGKTKKEI